MSDPLRPHGLQHTRLPCPSPTPGAYSNSCSLSWWYHPTISFSVIPFSSCLQSFPAPRSFQMSQFFASSGQIIGVSASASVLSMNISSLGGHVFPFQLLWAKCPYQKRVRNTSTWPFHDLDPQLHSSKCNIWLEGPRETDLVLKKMK